MLLRYCFFRDALLQGPYLQKAKLPAVAEGQPSPALCHCRLLLPNCGI